MVIFLLPACGCRHLVVSRAIFTFTNKPHMGNSTTRCCRSARRVTVQSRADPNQIGEAYRAGVLPESATLDSVSVSADPQLANLKFYKGLTKFSPNGMFPTIKLGGALLDK